MHACGTACFADAIFENNLLAFVSAIAMWGCYPLTLAQADGLLQPRGNQERVGFVVYWCLKFTLSLTRVALIFAM
jgi:hypothetical protein